MARLVSHITIRNYKGIAERELDVGEHGAIIHGRNRSGKTSILDAVRAALGGATSPDAIRLGADKAEIFVDLGDAAVQRIIGERGTSVEVTTGAGDERATIAKPAAWLGKLLGAGQLDPLKLVLEKERGKQKAAVLAALPMTVTVAQLREMVPGLPDDFSCDGHALDVVGGLRSVYEAQRKEANALAKKLVGAAEEASSRVGLDFGAKEDPAADEALTAAVRRRTEIDSQAGEAAASRRRVEHQHAKAVELQARAQATREAAPPDNTAEVLATDAALCATENDWANAKAEAFAAESRVYAARLARQRTDSVYKEREKHMTLATDLEAEAKTILDTIASALTPAPTPEVREAAERAVAAARARVDLHRQAVERDAAVLAATVAAGLADGAKAAAKSLDAIVKALAQDVPAKLIASSDAIPGLGIDGDDITLDGVSLGQINDEARLRFAVKLAKRATPAVKMLITDGLERLDPDQYEAFLKEAVADGWQLLGARVDRGEIRIEAIGEEER